MASRGQCAWIGGQQPPEVMRGALGVSELPVVLGQFGAELAENADYCGGAEHLAGGAGHALEQEWLGHAGQLVVRIEAGNQRDRRPFSGVLADDGHDDVGARPTSG